MKMLSRLAAFAAAGLFSFAVCAATLLPPGMQTFVDANGAPLAGASVQFYIPGTTTPKDTYQDAAQTTLNTNPVILDSSGRAVIFGVGAYREILKDVNGNLIWDQQTGDATVGSSSWGGIGGGTANVQTVSATNFADGDGQSISYIPAVSNTGAASIAANGLPPISILKDTSSGPTLLSGGELVAGNIATLIYDVSRGAFHLQGTPPQFSSRTNITAAATTDVGSISSHFAYVTGAATIVSFGSSCSTASPIYYAQFSGGQAITYNTTSMITPSGSSIVATNAGDSAVLECLGSGNWQILSYNGPGGNAPPGEVAAFNLAACPIGWAPADGTNGTADARGVAIRGLDNGRGLDAGRTLATYQADQLQDHTHNQTVTNNQNSNLVTNGSDFKVNIGTTTIATSIPVTGNHGSETRMKNVALLYCEKL